MNEEKDYLGFDSDIEITDDDIAFLLDGMKLSDITLKISDDELNKICDFYNGKVVCLEFDEFRCKTFGKCHCVKVVDDKFVFLFKHVVDIYDDNFECNESKDDGFVEVEAPYDVYIYFAVSEMSDRIIIDDMNLMRSMLDVLLLDNDREYFWWLMTVYEEDYKNNPNLYEKFGSQCILKDENDDVIQKCFKDGIFEYKLFVSEKYERCDITKNELNDICDFYKGQYVIMMLNDQPHFGRISHMDIDTNTHKVKLFFDILLVNDDGLWVKVVDKNSLKFELGTDFNNYFFNKKSSSSDDIIHLLCHYIMQLNRNEICLRNIYDECD